jgi:phage terminase large subunit-like protein
VFFRRAWLEIHPSTPLEWGPHIEAVCFHVETQLRDRWRARDDLSFAMRAQNILINVAPRSLKSTILALACAWAWLHEPTMAILALSANPQVGLTNSRIVHTLIQTPWYQSLPGAVTLNPERSALTDFGVLGRKRNAKGELEHDDNGRPLWIAAGSRVCRGLDSNITGIGSDWIQVDDPHDVRDSEENIRTTVEGYDAAVHNRINNPRLSIRTAIMQRFRVDDFSGHVLEPNGAHAKSWLHVRIPTEFVIATTCTCGTCVGVNAYGWKDWRTLEGVVVHPRFTGAFLLGEQRRLGPYGYAGQHQQEPSPPTGGMWKNRWFGWFRLPEDTPVDGTAWKRPPGSNEDPTLILTRTKRGTLTDGRLHVSSIVISIDGTFGNLKEHEGSAVGIGLFARLGMEWLLLDDQTEPISYLDTLDRIRELVRRHAHEAPMSILVEPKAFGPQAVEQLRRDVREGNLVDRSGKRVIVKIEVAGGADVDGEGRKGISNGDKVTRFYAASPDLAAKVLRLREGAAYCAPYMKETGQFPKAPRDDRVDMTTQLINHYHETSDTAHARAMLLR